jgi:hypothetical protein
MPETESKPEDFEVKIKELVDSKFQLQKNVTEELDRKITQLKDTVDAAGNNVRDFNQFYKDNFNAEKDGISNINIFKQNLATLSTLEAELQETKEKIKKLDEESADIVVKIKASKENILGSEEKSGLQKDIIDFHTRITAFENELFASGLKEKVINFCKDFFETIHSDGSTKIDLVKADIANIAEFNNQINTKIKKEVEDKLKDIESLRSEVEATLSTSSIYSLGLGYKQSMMLYGYVDFHEKRSHGFLSWDTGKFITQALINFLVGVFNYILFIAPLLMVLCVFVEPNFIEKFTLIDFSKLKDLDGWEYIIFKISVSVPMLWISWYGQKNVSTRKRLFEEYNHKFRVVQMYLAFIGKKEVYNLENKTELEKTLLEIVSRNPASFVYRKDETFLDKIANLVEIFKKPITSAKE